MIINEKYVKLRKNQAVRWHRRMWNWIAEQIRDGAEVSPHTIPDLKREFVKKHKIEIDNDCFCCDYAFGKIREIIFLSPCIYCPVKWEYGECKDGEYSEILSTCVNKDREEAYRLARAIARLPKREVR